MTNTRRLWLPAGDLTQEQRLALSVETGSKPPPDLYRQMLAQKLQALVDEDPQAARRGLEMSQEQAPALWAIAEESRPSEWGQRLMMCDPMDALISKADLAKPGTLSQEEPLELMDILEMLG